MAVIDEYIWKANNALLSGDSKHIDSIAREIVSVFNGEIPNLSHYRGVKIGGDGSNPHTSADLRKLVGKLRVLQETQDDDLYGQYGLTAITDSIRQLELAIAECSTQSEYKVLFDKIDHIYANKYDDYVDGLCGYWYNDDVPDESQARLRLEKLRVIRDEEMRKIRIAEAQHSPINVTSHAEATATSIAIAGLMETCEKIDDIPDDKLSEEDKDLLKGMLASLEQSVDKNKADKPSKLSRILGFLADKGTDAFIASGPFIWNLIQSI